MAAWDLRKRAGVSATWLDQLQDKASSNPCGDSCHVATRAVAAMYTRNSPMLPICIPDICWNWPLASCIICGAALWGYC